MREKLARLVHNGDLAASAQARVNAKHADRASRCGQQKMLQILAENLNGIRIGAALQFQPEFALNRRVEQPLPAIFDRKIEVRCPVSLRAQDARTQEP